MAYSSVRVQFEIGHEASVRNKKTLEGFTHDWEVFVRGADNTEIQCFVEKVVFHLHETFQKPRRVIKEPPYSVKESGYAGFVLPIDVYLKNKEEPKKINFEYDLQLQTSGPPISRTLREPRVFQNPSEDFRRKLIRGGGVGVDSPPDVGEDSKPPAPPKPKVPESPAKRHKSELPLSNSFADLFGPPIWKGNPETKKPPEPPKKQAEIASKDKKPIKHSPVKEEREGSKDKGRDKSKEKNMKRPPSPPPIKKVEVKKHEEKKKDDLDEKRKKKEEKERRDKHKEVKEERPAEKEIKKEKREVKEEYVKRNSSSKPQEPPPVIEKQSNDVDKDKNKPEKETKHKHRHKKKEKEKNREKEKYKKEKEVKEKEMRERAKLSSKKKHEEMKVKVEKVRKSRSVSPVPPPEKTKKGPLNTLLDELGSSDSVSPLTEDEDHVPAPPKPVPVPVPETKSVPTAIPKLKSTNTSEKIDVRKPEESSSKKKREKSPGRKKTNKESEKRKKEERSVSSEKEDLELEKQRREKEEKERLEKERQERERLEVEKSKAMKKEKDSSRKRKREKVDKPSPKVIKKEEDISASQSSVLGESESSEETRKTDRFTKEYVAQLRDLQHRIMTLEDNEELQKVVQVIAETGQYEITKKTFDFDLCALDGHTVRRLQEFFST